MAVTVRCATLGPVSRFIFISDPSLYLLLGLLMRWLRHLSVEPELSVVALNPVTFVRGYLLGEKRCVWHYLASFDCSLRAWSLWLLSNRKLFLFVVLRSTGDVAFPHGGVLLMPFPPPRGPECGLLP